MRKTFIQNLLQIAQKNPNIFLLTPDIGYSVLEPFQKAFPDRYLNTGITEQATIGIAAGLALRGKIPFVYTIIPFITMRCYEQIRLDIAYHNLPVRLVGVGAGYSYGAAGNTHHAIEDIAIMRALPNMTVVCPGDPWEMECLLHRSLDHSHPIYFRLGKNGEPLIHLQKPPLHIGKGCLMREGKDGIIIVTSNMLEIALTWVQKSSELGLELTLVSMHTIKPLDKALIHQLIDRRIPILTLEEHSIIGGLGGAVAEVIAEKGIGMPFKRLGIQDQFCDVTGSQDYLRKYMHLLDFDSFYSFFYKANVYV